MDQMTAEKAKLCKEKIDLEAALESESEYIVNKLQVCPHPCFKHRNML